MSTVRVLPLVLLSMLAACGRQKSVPPAVQSVSASQAPAAKASEPGTPAVIPYANMPKIAAAIAQ